MNWLHFIGKKYYSIAQFEREAKRAKVSRRVSMQILKKINYGDTVYLFQGNSKSSILFGHFVVENILGNFPNEFFEENKNLLKKVVPDGMDDFRGLTIQRGCGSYVLGAIYSVSASIPELAEKMERHEIKNLMIGGTYYPHKHISSKIPFQMGYRTFDYDGFIKEYDSMREKKRKTVQRQYYGKEEYETLLEEGFVRKIESYQRR